MEEKDFCAGVDVGGKAFQFIHHVIDTVDAEGDADAGDAGYAEGAGEIVITAATADAAHLDAEGVDLEDGAGVIIKTPGEGRVEDKRGGAGIVEDGFEIGDALETGVVAGKEGAERGDFFGVGAGDGEILFDEGDLGFGEAAFGEFGFDFFQADLVELVDGDGDAGEAIGAAARTGRSEVPGEEDRGEAVR